MDQDSALPSPRWREALPVTLVALSVASSVASAFLLLSLMGKTASCTIQLAGSEVRIGAALLLSIVSLGGIVGARLGRPTRRNRSGPGIVAFSWMLAALSILALTPFIAIVLPSSQNLSQIDSVCGMTTSVGYGVAFMGLLPLLLTGAWASLVFSGILWRRVVLATLISVVAWITVVATLLSIQSRVTG